MIPDPFEQRVHQEQFNEDSEVHVPYDTEFDSAVILVRLLGPLSHWTRTVCSAVLAVLGVNAVLVMFVFAAFGEAPEAVAKKQD